MACYHPNKAFIRRIPGSGRTEVIVASYSTNHIEIDEQGRVYKSTERFVRDSCKICIREWRAIPCGQCIGCRLEYSRNWANRCSLEMRQHEKNSFITLTYNEENIPRNPAVDGKAVDPLTGEVSYVFSDTDEVATLKKEDLTNFFKALRRKLNEIPKESDEEEQRYYKKGDDNFKSFRYFASGEYGDGGRPHYHILLFGWSPDDLVSYKKSELGFDYYTSEVLNEIWKKGYVVIAEASWETAAYVARYVMKKAKGKDAKIYEENNVIPEFCTMSRNPGIGKMWYDNNKKCYATFSNKVLPSKGKKRTFNRIRYFDKQFEEEFPFDYETLKEKSNNFQRDKIKLQLMNTSLDYQEQLEVEEEIQTMKTQILSRKGGEHYQKKDSTWIRQKDF